MKVTEQKKILLQVISTEDDKYLTCLTKEHKKNIPVSTALQPEQHHTAGKCDLTTFRSNGDKYFVKTSPVSNRFNTGKFLAIGIPFIQALSPLVDNRFSHNENIAPPFKDGENNLVECDLTR